MLTSENLYNVRRALRITQRTMALLMGVPVRTLGDWESHGPRYPVMTALALRSICHQQGIEYKSARDYGVAK